MDKTNQAITFTLIAFFATLGLMIFFGVRSWQSAVIFIISAFPFSLGTLLIIKKFELDILVGLIVNSIWWFYSAKLFLHLKYKYQYQDTED